MSQLKREIRECKECGRQRYAMVRYSDHHPEGLCGSYCQLCQAQWRVTKIEGQLANARRDLEKAHEVAEREDWKIKKEKRDD